MENGDAIVRYVAGNGTARVVVVLTTELAREAARRHNATPAAAVAMGRAGTAALLLATMTKGDERITLQILGTGPLGALTVDASVAGTARMFVGNPRAAHMGQAVAEGGVSDAEAELARPRLANAVGRTGLVSVVRDLGLGHTFSGQTPFVDGEIDTDVERYLRDSEQIDSALACETLLDSDGRIRGAAGILVQALPGGNGTALITAARKRMRAGSVALYLAGLNGAQAIADEVAGVTLGEDAEALNRLGPDRPIRFHCPCSHQRAATTLELLGAADLATMIREDGQALVTCEFCRSDYSFDSEQLETIRAGLARVDVVPN